MWITNFLVMLTSLSVDAQKIKDSIYAEVDDIRPCFRRMNGTGEIGCTSKIGGNVGVVMYVKDPSDLEKVKDTTFAPYIVLIDPLILSGSLLNSLKLSGNVNGVILPSVKDGLWEGHYPKSGFSDDSSCPNADSSCSQSNPWNPSGTDTMWVDWGFPIFLVENSNATENLRNCYLKYNEKTPLSWPLCSMELKSNMYGAKDSQTCIRRSNLFSITPLTVCDPLSDNNIHYFVTPRNSTTDKNTTKVEADNSVIIVSARLDALSLFDQVEVGFDSPSTGIVTLLAVANLVAQTMKEASLRYQADVDNILFLLIHGESFDYIGSSRLIYDIENGAFPYNISDSVVTDSLHYNGTQPLFKKENIRSFIELDQLSNFYGNGEVYLHAMNDASNIVDALRKNQGSLSITAEEGLPPSSAKKFDTMKSRIPSVVVTNYQQQYSNPMYHSIYDSADKFEYSHEAGPNQPVVQHLSKVVSMVAGSVLFLATGQKPQLKDQNQLVNELLHCYTITANCSMFHEASEPNNYPWIFAPESRRKTPFPQYVGVRSSYHTLMTKLLLQYLTGVPEPLESENDAAEEVPDISDYQAACLAKNSDQHVYRYVYLVGEGCYNTTSVQCGTCFRTTVHTSEAASPAFLPDVMEDYDWSSGIFPTWTESIWKVISGRLFLQGSPQHDHGIFAMGIIMLILPMLTVFWLNKNLTVIFSGRKNMEVDNPLPVEM